MYSYDTDELLFSNILDVVIYPYANYTVGSANLWTKRSRSYYS